MPRRGSELPRGDIVRAGRLDPPMEDSDSLRGVPFNHPIVAASIANAKLSAGHITVVSSIGPVSRTRHIDTAKGAFLDLGKSFHNQHSLSGIDDWGSQCWSRMVACLLRIESIGRSGIDQGLGDLSRCPIRQLWVPVRKWFRGGIPL